MHPLFQKATGLTETIIAAVIEVHRDKGPELIESIYEWCLLKELGLRGLTCVSQKSVLIAYKGFTREEPLRFDVLVEACLLVEAKAVEKILPIHKAQLLSYMKLLDVPLGLLINLHAMKVTDGISRLILPGAILYCHIVDAHFFRGRLSAGEADARQKLYVERVFDDILMGEGVVTHYLPVRRRMKNLFVEPRLEHELVMKVAPTPAPDAGTEPQAAPVASDWKDGEILALHQGFGFIKAAGFPNNVFFHWQALRNKDFNTLQKGAKVRFHGATGSKGHIAQDVEVIE